MGVVLEKWRGWLKVKDEVIYKTGKRERATGDRPKSTKVAQGLGKVPGEASGANERTWGRGESRHWARGAGGA